MPMRPKSMRPKSMRPKEKNTIDGNLARSLRTLPDSELKSLGRSKGLITRSALLDGADAANRLAQDARSGMIDGGKQLADRAFTVASKLSGLARRA